ncbi:MAG: IS1595 family transposase [Candidatus Methylomirabilales bacterium]
MFKGEYPRTLAEFDRCFATEEHCRRYLLRLRWPSGFRCPGCRSPEAWPTKRGLLHCRKCDHQASITAGTVFHRTRKPLRLWFQVMWWVAGQKNGASALGLQRLLGLGSYQTAWAWLHKIRRAMVRPGRDRLTGEVEVDETFIGGVEKGGGRRHVGKKALVAVAAEVRGTGTGRIRLQRVQDSSAQSLVGFVKQAVEPGSFVVTDGLPSYVGLEAAGYGHRPRVVRGSGKEADSLLPRVHRVASLLKRWLLGTHQGRVERKHLPYYLDEFTFRFNRRTSRSRGLLFYRLAQQAVAIQPTPYRDLVTPPRVAPHNR